MKSLWNYYKESKNFILSAVAAAILGYILLFTFGGCSGGEDEPEVVKSKRVRVELPEEDVSAGKDLPPVGEGSPMVKAAEEAREGATEAVVKDEKPAEVEKKTEEPARQAKKTAPAEPERPALSASDAEYAINVASFTDPKGANDLMKKLSRDGYNAYITEFTKNGTRWHRVRVGFFATRDEAKNTGSAIKKSYRVDTPWIVKPSSDEVEQHLKD